MNLKEVGFAAVKMLQDGFATVVKAGSRPGDVVGAEVLEIEIVAFGFGRKMVLLFGEPVGCCHAVVGLNGGVKAVGEAAHGGFVSLNQLA